MNEEYFLNVQCDPEDIKYYLLKDTGIQINLCYLKPKD